MPNQDERAEIEAQILKARELGKTADAKTKRHLEALTSALEQKLREIDK